MSMLREKMAAAAALKKQRTSEAKEAPYVSFVETLSKNAVAAAIPPTEQKAVSFDAYTKAAADKIKEVPVSSLPISDREKIIQQVRGTILNKEPKPVVFSLERLNELRQKVSLNLKEKIELKKLEKEEAEHSAEKETATVQSDNTSADSEAIRQETAQLNANAPLESSGTVDEGSETGKESQDKAGEQETQSVDVLSQNSGSTTEDAIAPVGTVEDKDGRTDRQGVEQVVRVADSKDTEPVQAAGTTQPEPNTVARLVELRSKEKLSIRERIELKHLESEHAEYKQEEVSQVSDIQPKEDKGPADSLPLQADNSETALQALHEPKDGNGTAEGSISGDEDSDAGRYRYLSSLKALSFKERIEFNKLERKFRGAPIALPEDTPDFETIGDNGKPEKQQEQFIPPEEASEETETEKKKGILGRWLADEMLKLNEKEQTTAMSVIETHIEQQKAAMSFAERIAQRRAEQKLIADNLAEAPAMRLNSALSTEATPDVETKTVGTDVKEKKHETFAIDIILNEDQLLAKELAFAGKSFCLIGAAGTGKTSTQRDVAKTLVLQEKLRSTDFKIANGGGARTGQVPSIAFVAYTRRASANLARAIHKDPALSEVLTHNIMTIHHLLEYEPVQFYDEEKQKDSMRFEPMRTSSNPLTITHLVIEEASMVGLDLWENLFAALPLGVQIIFIGDINQLPPVFGASILNYALVQLPVVELKKVYRQESDSLVLANAHHILKGQTLEEGTGFTIVRGKSPVQVGQEKMSQTLAQMFKQLYQQGQYNPEDCIILTPWNKQGLGTMMMNRHISQFLGQERGAIVFEILAGRFKHYLAVGDQVMYNKQDGVITSIAHNGLYHGKSPQAPGADLTRFGMRIMGMDSKHDVDLDEEGLLSYSDFSVDELAEVAAERKQQASHIVTITMETGLVVTLDSAGDFGDQVFSLGYVLTVHKAQGCEWRKVFGILHKDHAVSLARELFYTMVTRAREEVVLIAKDTVIEKAIRTQRIKGDTLAEKIEFFNSGALDAYAVQCTK